MTTYIQIPVEGGGSDYWIDAVANFAALPTPGPVDGAVALTLDTNLIWRWDAGTVAWVAASSSASGFVGGFAVVSTAGGLAESLVTTTELGYVAGVTSAIQTQLNAKLALAGGTMTGTLVLAGAPVGANDAVTLAYLQSTVEGFSPKLPVLVSTTANIALTGEQTLDGVLTAASRVLVRFQTAPAENGIYVSAAGAWARSADMNAWSEVPSAFVIVETGTVYGDTGWLCTSNPGGTLGTTAITWGQWFGVGTYTADGTYVALTGSQFSLSAAAATSINDVQAATDANTASTLVKRDASGNFAAGTITASLTGNASGSAASFTGSLVGDVTGTQGATVVATVGGKTAADVAQSVTDTVAATSVNTASTIVKRDASGNFAAGTITTPEVAGVAGAGTNIAGGDHTVSGGTSTGNAAGGSIIFRTSPAGASGAGVNALSDQMRILSTGNVGVGTTTPTNRLAVSGGILAQGVGVDPGGNGVVLSSEATSDRLQSYNARSLALNPLGNKVGIGTASPSSNLEVSTTSTGTVVPFRVLAPSNTGGGNSTFASIGVTAASKNSAEVAFTYAGSGSNSNNAIFRVNGTTGVVVAGSGNVGIATTAPAAPLHIAGTSAILGTGEGGTPSTALFRGANGGGTDRVGGAMTIQASNGTGAGGSGAISFQTAPVAASGSTVNVLATVMTITPSARVGVGNSSPTNTLDVTGGVTALSGKFGATGTAIASAALEVSSTTQAFYPPRMTSAQRTAISAANGALIYNTDTDRFEGYVAGSWTALHGWGT